MFTGFRRSPDRGADPAAHRLPYRATLALALLRIIDNMDSTERQVLLDLIASVRAVAKQTLALHLQLGGVRTLLARKGTISMAELEAIVAELDALTAVDEFVAVDAPSPDEVFDNMLRRLGEAP